MTEPVIAIFDKKTGFFDQPIPVRHTAEAIRIFNQKKTDPNSKISQHLEDVILVEIASYDPITGKFQNLQVHNHLATGV